MKVISGPQSVTLFAKSGFLPSRTFSKPCSLRASTALTSRRHLGNSALVIVKAEASVRSRVSPKTHRNGSNGAASKAPTTPDLPTTNEKVTLYYSTGWQNAVLRFSLAGAPWTDRRIEKVTSSSGHWMIVELELPSDASQALPSTTDAAAVPLLEFVVTNGAGEWDKPATGGNYIIDKAGVWRLSSGTLEASTGEPFLVISDLDDTMIGNDASTAAFKEWWESEGVPLGGRLVYNTGRALDKYLSLMGEKAWCLAKPDALISSVGTKVYVLQGGSWIEDASWAQRLNRGWNLEVVREATYAALASVGRERMHFRPPDEQNEHKVTCGIHVEVVDRVQELIKGVLDTAEVEARLILSGRGDWRYLDVVSSSAGKLEALEWVRQSRGVPEQRTVACGDSGNDKDMLSGKNLAIVVGNAQPDMKEWVAATLAKEAGSNGSRRMLSVNAHMAAGILEGLETFGFKSRN